MSQQDVLSVAEQRLKALGVKVDGKQAEVPAGGEFQSSGFVGPLMAGMFFSISSQENYTQYNRGMAAENQVPSPDYFEPMGNWGYRYYYVDKDAANKACELIGSTNNEGKKILPQMLWHTEMERDQILNWASSENRLKWAEILSQDCAVKTTASKKYRHEYQMITLPSAVQAAALYLGMLDAPVWNMEELLDRNTVYDDEFFAQHFGDPTAKKDDLEAFNEYVQSIIVEQGVPESQAIRIARESGIVKVPYQFSIYWERRDVLWNALGEKNPESCLPIVRDANGEISKNQPKKAVSSLHLDYCIKFATSRWEKPVWARIMYVSDPRVDATFDSNGEERRSNLVVISEIFTDRNAAAEVVGAESEGDASDVAEARAAVQPAEVVAIPTVPANWAAVNFSPEMFLEQIKNKGDIPAAEIASGLQCSVDEINAFLEWGKSK